MLHIEQLYTSCLSEAAYYIESDGEVAIIDPLRDTAKYISMAKERKATIKYIFETHVHADFVSGHLDLARETGASIIFGPDAQTEFEKYTAKDNEEFKLGKVILRTLHTPGHTLESTCFLLIDEAGKPNALFTGDTLFVGDVGQPDLFSGKRSKEELASMLYDSLQRLKQLPDEVKVYPAHGLGSSCGKQIGPNRYSTIGEEKQNNYAMREQSKVDFIEAVREGLRKAPAYFPINASINQKGYISLDKIKANGLRSLSLKEFKALMADNALVLDTRKATEFTEGFVPSSINIGLEGRFAEWAGAILPFNETIVLITEPGMEEETLIRLSRVGFDKIAGFLEGGYTCWHEHGEEIDMIIDIEADELKMDLNYDPKILVVDVRTVLEYQGGHVQTAVSLPLDTLADPLLISRFEEQDNVYVYCGGGYRSVIASSLFKRQGFHNLRNVLGGYEEIKAVPGMPLVAAKEVLN